MELYGESSLCHSYPYTRSLTWLKSTVFAALVVMCQSISHLSLMEASYCEHREMIDRAVAALQGSCYGDVSREMSCTAKMAAPAIDEFQWQPIDLVG